MLKRFVRLLAFCAGIFVVMLPGMGQAQLTLYDNFNSASINPDNWHGSQNQPGASAPITETSRRITAKKLELQAVSYGEDTSDVGTAPSGIQALRVNDPSSVTAMQVRVTVQNALAQTCAANASLAQARAGIFGVFFNDGSSTGSEDETGDVRLLFELRRDSSGARIIRASITSCDDPGCDNFTVVDSHTFTTSWKVGVPRTLRLEWDQANDQFLVTLNPGTAGEETGTLSYSGLSDADPPVNDRKELRVQTIPVNCTASRTKASMTAHFDNAMLNP